ncbi:hypothetical protein MR730_03550 [bacterium]|nr:hypothetical protein [bacterium]
MLHPVPSVYCTIFSAGVQYFVVEAPVFHMKKQLLRVVGGKPGKFSTLSTGFSTFAPWKRAIQNVINHGGGYRLLSRGGIAEPCNAGRPRGAASCRENLSKKWLSSGKKLCYN